MSRRVKIFMCPKCRRVKRHTCARAQLICEPCDEDMVRAYHLELLEDQRAKQ